MKKKQKFRNGLKTAFSSRWRSFASLSLALAVFIAMNLAARPLFSMQMLSSSIFLLPEAVYLVFLHNSANFLQMISTVVYAFLAGPALVLMYLQFRNFGSGFPEIMGIAPGMLASGCAGCGAGIIGLLGLTGALAALPFNGLLITPVAILLLVYFITKSGNPEICNLD